MNLICRHWPEIFILSNLWAAALLREPTRDGMILVAAIGTLGIGFAAFLSICIRALAKAPK
jgi:hypothetical protein